MLMQEQNISSRSATILLQTDVKSGRFPKGIFAATADSFAGWVAVTLTADSVWPKSRAGCKPALIPALSKICDAKKNVKSNYCRVSRLDEKYISFVLFGHLILVDGATKKASWLGWP